MKVRSSAAQPILNIAQHHLMENDNVPASRTKLVYLILMVLAFILLLFVLQLPRLSNVERNSEQYNDVMSKSHIRAMLYSWLANRYSEREVYENGPFYQDSAPPPSKVISCYYNLPSELTSRQLLPNDINPHLCTHLNLAFVKIVNKEIALTTTQRDVIQEIVKIKEKNPDLKILLSIGGAGTDNGFPNMVVDHASRKTFIKSLKSILRELNLDGVDLDWEFPAVHSKKVGKDHARERQHFSQLLREIRVEYQREKRDYLLTVAAAAPEMLVDAAYDVDQLNMYTDYVNLMTYDFHFFTKYTPLTGLNSPLYPRPEEKLFLSTLNINYTVSMYITKGLEPDKIVVGIPTYGHSFTLVNPDNTNIGSPAVSYGSLGSYGFVDYPDICKFIKDTANVTVKVDEDSQVPYLFKDREWVSFDSPSSVDEKARYIREHRLRGAMIYSLNSDDYQGVCELSGTEKFPLSHSVKNALVRVNEAM